jgi:hypothetical protein
LDQHSDDVRRVVEEAEGGLAALSQQGDERGQVEGGGLGEGAPARVGEAQLL